MGADRGRQPKTGPQFVDRARLAVVEGEDDRIRALRGRQREPHRGNGVDHVRPANLLTKRAGRLACAESACRLDWQHHRQDERRGERGRRQHEPRAHPVGCPPDLDPDSPCGQQVDVGRCQVINLGPRRQREEDEQQAVGPDEGGATGDGSIAIGIRSLRPTATQARGSP